MSKNPAEKAALLELSSPDGGALPYDKLITAVQRRAAEVGVVLEDGYEPALRKFIIHSGEIQKRGRCPNFKLPRWEVEKEGRI